MIDDRRRSFWQFILIVFGFGTTGFINLFILSILKPRWFKLFLKVLRFFVTLPFRFKPSKEEIFQGFYIIDPRYRCKASAIFFTSNPALAGFIYKHFNTMLVISCLVLVSSVGLGLYTLIR